MIFSKNVKESVVSALEIPRDLAFQDTVVTITGPAHVLIENYKGIGKISQEEIILLGFRGKIILQGKRMNIVKYSPNEMIVTGMISEISLKR